MTRTGQRCNDVGLACSTAVSSRGTVIQPRPRTDVGFPVGLRRRGTDTGRLACLSGLGLQATRGAADDSRSDTGGTCRKYRTYTARRLNASRTLNRRVGALSTTNLHRSPARRGTFGPRCPAMGRAGRTLAGRLRGCLATAAREHPVPDSCTAARRDRRSSARPS